MHTNRAVKSYKVIYRREIFNHFKLRGTSELRRSFEYLESLFVVYIYDLLKWSFFIELSSQILFIKKHLSYHLSHCWLMFPLYTP